MLTIILPKGEFSSSMTIKGQVELVPDNKFYINDIEMTFYYTESWNYLISENKYDKKVNKVIITSFNLGVNKILPEGDNNLIHLDPILHLFPFEIKVPDYLFSSFEYPVHDYKAYVRYTLVAKLKSPYRQLSTSINFFIISTPKSNIENIKLQHSFTIKKWGLFNKGTTICSIFLPSQYYKFSDVIPITFDIDNTNGKMKANLVKFNLIRRMSYREYQNNNSIEKYNKTDKVFKKVFKIEVKSGNKGYYNFGIPLTDIPYNEFSYFDNLNLYDWKKRNCEFIPSLESNIINCQYTLKITLYFDSFIKKADRPRVRIPIFIVHRIEGDLVKKENFVTSKAEETTDNAIKENKKDDFVTIEKSDCNINKTFFRAKTLNNNGTYIDNISQNKIYDKPNNIYNNENNDQFNTPNMRTKTYLESNKIEEKDEDKKQENNIINEIKTEDIEDAPPICSINNINSDISKDNEQNKEKKSNDKNNNFYNINEVENEGDDSNKEKDDNNFSLFGKDK